MPLSSAARPRPRASVLVRLLLCGLVGVLLVTPPGAAEGAPAAGEPTTGSSGAGDPYFPQDGNGGYDVRHYTIRDTYDPATDELSGRTVLTLVPAAEADPLQPRPGPRGRRGDRGRVAGDVVQAEPPRAAGDAGHGRCQRARWFGCG